MEHEYWSLWLKTNRNWNGKPDRPISGQRKQSDGPAEVAEEEVEEEEELRTWPRRKSSGSSTSSSGGGAGRRIFADVVGAGRLARRLVDGRRCAVAFHSGPGRRAPTPPTGPRRTNTSAHSLTKGTGRLWSRSPCEMRAKRLSNIVFVSSTVGLLIATLDTREQPLHWNRLEERKMVLVRMPSVFYGPNTV